MPKSIKQKLNTRSSTESELVGASDATLFLGMQGNKIENNIYFQDNKSTIHFETNGRNSCGSKSRHINIRYFWIKNRLESERIKVKHCPTLQMLADFFTKPLQGSLFVKLRDVIMGIKHIDTLRQEIKSLPVQERVEENKRNNKWPGSNDNGQTIISTTKDKVTHSYKDALMNKKRVRFQDNT